jgi:hypothetical protein
MQIQEYLTCAIQNIQLLIGKAAKPKRTAAAKALAVDTARTKAIRSLIVAVLAAYYGQRACLRALSRKK